MEQLKFSELLLKTAFSCMACDGDVDKQEVELIRTLHQEHRTFGDLDINEELNSLLLAINKDGHQFLRDYFSAISSASLSEEEEVQIIKVAIDIIKADDKIEYSEIKFFKVIRSKLKVENEKILNMYPDFEEYLEEDIISEAYLSRLQNDFFDLHILPELILVDSLIDNIDNRLNNEE